MVDIIGFTNYTINEKGEIYSKKRKIIMKQRSDKDGYLGLKLFNDDGVPHSNIRVHRLLYQAFILKIGEEMPRFIDHKNGNVKDNSLDNLRGATSQQNNWNRRTAKNNRTGYKNIHHTPNGTFRVSLARERYSKMFKTLEEAIINRNIVVASRGEFANNGDTPTIQTAESSSRHS
jgi:hypothetical protein